MSQTLKQAEQKVNEAKLKETKRFEVPQEKENKEQNIQKSETDAEKITGPELDEAAAKNVTATLNKQAEEAEKKEDTRSPESAAVKAC